MLEVYYLCKLYWPGKGQVKVYYREIDSLLLKVKTDNLLDELENNEHISSQMDHTNWDESTYPKLVKKRAKISYYF